MSPEEIEQHNNVVRHIYEESLEKASDEFDTALELLEHKYNEATKQARKHLDFNYILNNS